MRLRSLATTAALLALAHAASCTRQADDETANYDAIKDTSRVQEVSAADISGLSDIVLPDGFMPGDTGDPPDGSGPDVAISTDIEAPPGSIKALQLEAETSGCDADQIQTIREGASVTGAVVTTPKFDAYTPSGGTGTALDGYYLSDVEGGPWAGIMLVIPRTENSNYGQGDVLDVTGSLDELFCQTQLRATTHSKTGSATVPSPRVLTEAAALVEAWEGTLVTVTGLEVAREISGGVYEMKGGLVVDHDFDFFLSLDQGVNYTITGAIRFSFGQYRLMPRTKADVQVHQVPVGDAGPTDTVTTDAGPQDAGPTVDTIAGLQQLPESLTCAGQSPLNYGKGLVVEGVTVTERFSLASNRDGFYIADGTQGDYSGVLVAVDKGADAIPLGHRVRVMGEHTEFYCMTQLGGDSVEDLGVADGAIEPRVVTALDEVVEGMLVRFENVTVTDSSAWQASGGHAVLSNGERMDWSIIGKNQFSAPANGTVYTSITGMVRESFESFRIVPRSQADLVAE